MTADSFNVTAPSGWYTDPHAPEFERYFDGESWTEQRRWAAPRPWTAAEYLDRDDEPRADTHKPPTYFLWAALITLIGFWPLGIPALWNAVQVNPAWARGDEDIAYDRSEKARRWVLLATIGSIIFTFFVLLNRDLAGS